ncbi:MAG TPA: hypothetical protein QGG47_10680 [Acidobacteriota bacterium]|nr:hypothetical protein [Acidobacteriota bacterium]
MRATGDRDRGAWASRSWASEAGRGGLGALLGLALVVATIYAGMKFIPVRAAGFQLDDTVREQVVFAGARRRQLGDNEVLRNIIERADELGLPVERRNIAIVRRRGTIQIRVVYTVPIDLLFDYTYVWRFEIDHNGPSF